MTDGRMAGGIAYSSSSRSLDLNRSENRPRQKMENMNGEYKISNPNLLAGAHFDSDYSKFSNVEYFDVSSTKPKLSSASLSSPKI